MGYFSHTLWGPHVKVLAAVGLVLFLGCALRGQTVGNAALSEAPSESIFKSKSFILPHAALFLSIGLDGELSRNLHSNVAAERYCKENNALFRSSSGDFQAGRFYVYNLSIAGGITAADYLLLRKWPNSRWVKLLTVGAPLSARFGAIDHVIGAASWARCF